MSDVTIHTGNIEVLGKLRQWYELVVEIFKRLPRRYILPVLNFALLLVIATALVVMIQGARCHVVVVALKEHAAFRSYVNVLYREFPELKTNPKAYIAKDDARPYLMSDKNNEVADAVFQLLNHFEELSLLYSSGLADGAAFEDSFKDMVGAWYGKLAGWMEAYNDHCNCTFVPFEKLGKKWIPVGRFTERAKPQK